MACWCSEHPARQEAARPARSTARRGGRGTASGATAVGWAFRPGAACGLEEDQGGRDVPVAACVCLRTGREDDDATTVGESASGDRRRRGDRRCRCGGDCGLCRGGAEEHERLQYRRRRAPGSAGGRRFRPARSRPLRHACRQQPQHPAVEVPDRRARDRRSPRPEPQDAGGRSRRSPPLLHARLRHGEPRPRRGGARARRNRRASCRTAAASSGSRSSRPRPARRPPSRRSRRAACPRAVYDGKPLSAETVAALEAAARSEAVDVIMITEPARIETILGLVVEGNDVQFTDPAFMAELKHWIRFDASEAIADRRRPVLRLHRQPVDPAVARAPDLPLRRLAEGRGRQVRGADPELGRDHDPGRQEGGPGPLGRVRAELSALRARSDGPRAEGTPSSTRRSRCPRCGRSSPPSSACRGGGRT